MSEYLNNIGARSKAAQRLLAMLSGSVKSNALFKMADALIENMGTILTANKLDIDAGRASGMNEGLIDRLTLNENRIKGMAQSIREIASASDPVGRVISGETRPNGLKIRKVSVPLGVIAIIFEARPNVTADAAALSIKAGNSVILKGGKEAVNSNKAVCSVMRAALASCGIPEDLIILIEDNSREVTAELMTLNEYVDVLIPRGGAGLINSVVKNSTVPVIQTGVGNCHVYVDEYADIDMAASVVFNAKTSRVSVCNACESLLVHRSIASSALPEICGKLRSKNVIIRGDEEVCSIIPYAESAQEDDWGREYLDYIISVKIVDSLDEAINHISRYGTGHSEAIITENYANANEFCTRVDAAAVYVNASTRFTDGGEFGFGAEIGISTQKLHARGPLGLDKLVSEKYVIEGNGQVR